MAVQFDFMGSSAQLYTGQSLQNSIMQQLFGGTPLGPLMPLLTPAINNMLGLEGPGYRSALMDTVLFSNMSPYGTYRGQMNERFNRVASDMLARQNNKARQNWLEGIGRTMMSFRSWQDLNGGTYGSDAEARAAYDSYIQNEARGRANNFFWQTGYRMLDPEGLGAAAEFLSQAGANQIRLGSLDNSRTAFARARAIGNMFINGNGEFEYNKLDYGSMTLGETAQVLAELTKGEDFFKDTKSIEEATGKLRKRVQEFTNALSPLKDVFGSDIPGMIRAIEDLSGQRMGSMDPTAIRHMTATVMANATAGGYNIGELVNMRSQVSNAIYQMNVPFLNDLAALPQAMTIMNMTANGMAPANMSLERYRQGAANFVQRTSGSSGAQYLNAAAALWLDRNKGKTFSDFMAAYRSARDTQTATTAMLSLSGAGSLYAMEDAAIRSTNYTEAYRNDIGGQLAREEQFDFLLDAAWRQSSNREAFDKARVIVKAHPELLADPSKAARYTKDQAVLGEITALSNGYGLQGGLGEALVTTSVAMAENRVTQKRAGRQMAMRDAMDAARVAIPTDFKEFINQFIHGNTNLSGLITNTAKLAMIGDAGVRQTVGTAIEMATLMATDLGLQDIGEDKAASNFANDFATYIFNNGASNEKMMDLIEKYERTKDPNKKAKYAARALMMRDLDTTRLDMYLEEFGEDKGWENLLSFRDELRTQNWEKGDQIAEMDDYLMVSAMDKALGGKHRGFFKQLRAAAIGKNGKGVAGYYSEKEALELADKYGKDNKLTTAQQEELNSTIKQVYGRDSSSDTQINDLLGAIANLIGDMSKLSAKMDKLLPTEANAPAAPQPTSTVPPTPRGL